MKKENKLSKIPDYLLPYIAKQDPSLYTAMDHASWRFILKLSRSFFSKHAHQKYLAGLKETGISVDRIPLIEEMNHCLKNFNWRAVPVSGFIPPAVFMEFLSLGILPIACDMRQLDHLSYTPAPDIVHEAAGHAPILADPEYASYLRCYGEISQKAIFSDQDMAVYNAIRKLSDIKEDICSTPEAVQLARSALDDALGAVTYESEATWLSRMGWWTFEYGLIGDLDHPKIYGAGLLSSLGESFHCFDPNVKKISFSIDCINVSFDITRPQPQLFVAPSFDVLKEALNQLAEKMAFKRGGIEGLERAIQSKTTTTVELDTGIQVSGVLSEFKRNERGEPYFIRFQGPSQISYLGKELEGQGARYHLEGFSSPLVELSQDDLDRAGFRKDMKGKIQLIPGMLLEGYLSRVLRHEDKIILASFEDCTVTEGSEILFKPEWGTFDMICGRKVVSVFGGAADRSAYLEAVGGFHQVSTQHKGNLTAQNRGLNALYSDVRKLRDLGQWDMSSREALNRILEGLEKLYPLDWLLRYELLELSVTQGGQFPWEDNLRSQLSMIAQSSPDKAELIQRGLSLL